MLASQSGGGSYDGRVGWKKSWVVLLLLSAIAALVGSVWGASTGVTYLAGTDELDCPTIKKSTVQTQTNISVTGGTLSFSTIATVMADGINPKNSPPGSMTLGFDYRLPECVLGVPGKTRALDWHDGKATFTFDLRSEPYYSWHFTERASSPETYRANNATINITAGGARVQFMPCRIESGVCKGAAEITSVLTLKKSPDDRFITGLRAPVAHPIPTKAAEGDVQRFEWRYIHSGGTSVESARLDFDVPPLVLAQSFLQSQQQEILVLEIGRGEVLLGLGFIFVSALSGIIMLFTGSIVLRRGDRRIPAIATTMALLLLGAVSLRLPSLSESRVDQAGLVAAGWALAAAALSRGGRTQRFIAILLAFLISLAGPLLTVPQITVL